MPRLLVWPLSLDFKIVFNAPLVDLGTITCCDTFDLILYHYDVEYVLQKNITGCVLKDFKSMLQLLVTGQDNIGDFMQVLQFGRDKFDQVLLKVFQDQKILCYSLVAVDIIVSWVAQLDLLLVVMQENENEKKSKTLSCCG